MSEVAFYFLLLFVSIETIREILASDVKHTRVASNCTELFMCVTIYDALLSSKNTKKKKDVPELQPGINAEITEITANDIK